MKWLKHESSTDVVGVDLKHSIVHVHNGPRITRLRFTWASAVELAGLGLPIAPVKARNG